MDNVDFESTIEIGDCVVWHNDTASVFKTDDGVPWAWEVTTPNLNTRLWSWCIDMCKTEFRISLPKQTLYFKTRDAAVNFVTFKAFAGY